MDRGAFAGATAPGFGCLRRRSTRVTGYSLDSVLDAGLNRFDSTVGKATKDLTDQLTEADTPA